MATPPKYAPVLRYIKRQWPQLTFRVAKDNGIQIGLPNRFVSPSQTHSIFEGDQFYWDSYFIILGLLAEGQVKLARGMVDNFLHLYRRFQIIPMRNRLYNLGISQPPFLTSMIREVFSATEDVDWLKNSARVAEQKLNNYWMDGSGHAEKHVTLRGLSRYCDHHITHLTAEHESGWDMTSRFADHCLDYLPVDLNSLLYKYETDLADIAGLLGNQGKRKRYLLQAKRRARNMTKLLWNERKGFFFDYNHHTGKQSEFYSIAGFYPLWAKLATKEQAEKVRHNLKKFEHHYGLANSQPTGLSKQFKQHDHPNGWPHQQWIVIQGLLNYGYGEDAKRIAEKWLDLNQRVFQKTGYLWEKYNVVTGGIGKADRYPTQKGFGWTDAVFVKLIETLYAHR